MLTVVDPAAGRVTDTVLLDGPPQSAVVSADGRHVYVALPGAVAVIDPVTGRQVTAIRVGPHPGHLALTPDGTRLLVPDQDDGTLTILDPARFAVVTTIRLAGPVVAVAVTPGGRRAFALDSEDGVLFGVDIVAGRVLGSARTGSLPSSVAVGPDLVAVANYDSGSVSLFDPAALTPVATVAVGETPQALTFGPDGRSLYVADDTGATLSVVDGLTHQVRASVPVGVGPAAVAVSRTGLVYVVDAKDENLSALRIPGLTGASG